MEMFKIPKQESSDKATPVNPSRREFIKKGLRLVAGGALLSYGVDEIFFPEGRLNEAKEISISTYENNDKKYPPMKWGENNLYWKDFRDVNVENLIKQIKTPSEVASFFSRVEGYILQAKKINSEYLERDKILSKKNIPKKVGRLPYITLSFKEWLTSIAQISKKIKILEDFGNELNLESVEQLFRKYRPEDVGDTITYNEGGVNLDSLLYRVYAQIILSSNMSEQEASDALAAPLAERKYIPYELALPKSYGNEGNQFFVNLYRTCKSINECELPVCRDADKAMMLLLYDNGYPAIELKLRSKENVNVGHVVYLVKSRDDQNNKKYGYIGFNQFEAVKPEFNSVAELFENKFSKVFTNDYRIVDYSGVIDSFK